MCSAPSQASAAKANGVQKPLGHSRAMARPGNGPDASEPSFLDVVLPDAQHVKAPSVSVIVTCYNYEQFLVPCLQAIADQTYPNFDCVIVDDASSDTSVAVVRKFLAAQNDDRFKLVEHEVNGGQMAAFKTGLAQSQGVFVVFVDADDILFPEFIQTHVSAHLNACFNVAFTCSDQIQISEKGEIIGGTYPQLLRQRSKKGALSSIDDPLSWDFDEKGPKLRRSPRDNIYLPAISRYVRDWFWTTTSAMMYRRAALSFVISDDCDDFRISADFYLVKYCQLVGGSLILPGAHGCYRRHGANGFGSTPVVGGEQSPADKLRHAPYGKFKASFTRHVVANFERYVAVLGSNHAHLILAQTAPKRAFFTLLRTGRSRAGEHFRPGKLLNYRFWWRLFEIVIAMSRRIRGLMSLFLRRSGQPVP